MARRPIHQDARARQRLRRARRARRAARARRRARRAPSPTGTPASAATSSSCIEPPRRPARAALHAHPQRRWRRGRGVRQCRALRRRAADARDAARSASRIETEAGLLEAERARRRGASASIWATGAHSTGARFRWRARCDTLHVPLSLGPLRDPVCTSMGNPHATFFVPTPRAIDHRDARPDARARSAVSRARQYRRRADPVADAIRAARVGARRRPDARPAAPAPAPRWSRRRAAASPGASAEIVADGGTLEIEWRARQSRHHDRRRSR